MYQFLSQLIFCISQVGQNLQRLAQLEGVDVTKYKNEILPKLLEQILQCNDKIAQQHLTEMLTQVDFILLFVTNTTTHIFNKNESNQRKM
jgi:phosphoglycerate dehydrogenase-like enzyme